MFALDSFYKQYQTDTTTINVAGRTFHMLLPRYLDEFIKSGDVFDNFPLWAKLWKASWVLSGYLADKAVEKNKVFIEIGAGVGLVSIVAWSFGHCITMTEHNADALQFAHANAHLNNCPQLPIIELDWNQPKLKGRFDYIVASEVVYKTTDFTPLVKLFQSYLKPDGEIILASEMRKTSGEFYKYLQPKFKIKTLKKILCSEDEKTLVILFRLKFQPKSQGA